MAVVNLVKLVLFESLTDAASISAVFPGTMFEMCKTCMGCVIKFFMICINEKICALNF